MGILLKMGGIEGRAYQSKSSLINAQQRHYMKYIKPIENANFDVGRLAFQALGATAGMYTSFNPKDWIDKAHIGAQIYDALDPRTFEAKRMAQNKPGDLTGKTYTGKSRIYN